jgi:hypothetical protein
MKKLYIVILLNSLLTPLIGIPTIQNKLILAIKQSETTKINSILNEISEGDEDVDVTECIQIIKFMKNKKASLSKCSQDGLWCTCGCTCAYLLYRLATTEFIPFKIEMSLGSEDTHFETNSHTDFHKFLTDKSFRQRYTKTTAPSIKVLALNGENETKELNLDKVKKFFKKTALVTLGSWGISTCGFYLYKNWYYNNLIKKILKTPHVICDLP